MNESPKHTHTHTQTAHNVYGIVSLLELTVMPLCVYLLVTDLMMDGLPGMFRVRAGGQMGMWMLGFGGHVSFIYDCPQELHVRAAWWRYTVSLHINIPQNIAPESYSICTSALSFQNKSNIFRRLYNRNITVRPERWYTRTHRDQRIYNKLIN